MGRGWALVDLASRLSRQKERAEAAAMAADIFAEAPARVGGARPLLALGALARRAALSQMKDRRVGSPGRPLRMLRRPAERRFGKTVVRPCRFWGSAALK